MGDIKVKVIDNKMVIELDLSAARYIFELFAQSMAIYLETYWNEFVERYSAHLATVPLLDIVQAYIHYCNGEMVKADGLMGLVS